MEKKQTCNPKKAFFFLRHNNDIDHTVPVLYKWLLTEDIPTDIIIPTDRNLLNDDRIKFLKQHKNANIYYLDDLFNKFSLEHIFNFLYFKYDTQFDNLFNRNSYAKKVADKRVKKIANKIFRGAESGIVVFDWTTTYFTKKMVEIAKEKNFTTISLPHGDRVFVSFMERKEQINYDHMTVYKTPEIFDYFVIANKPCAERHDKFLDKKKLKSRKARIEQVINGEVTGAATKDAIEAMQAALFVTCIVPTIVTTSIHT